MPKPICDFAATSLFKLIKLVKRRPFIWNTKYKKYNDRFLVSIGWKEIEEEMLEAGVTERILRQKWRNLRDTFRREYKKCPCQTPEDYKGKWMYFKALFFLTEDTKRDTTGEKESSEEDNDIEELLDGAQCVIKTESEANIDFEYKSMEANELIDDDTHEGDDLKFQTQNETSDYDLMFLKSLVPYFSDLDPLRKLVLRSELQNILLQELADQAECNGGKI